jgi:hypothetical protein
MNVKSPLQYPNNIGNRRAEERRRALWGSRLAHLDGSQYTKCQTLDFSAAGVRVQVEEFLTFSDNIYFLDLRSRLAYEARIVWRKAPAMGLQFIRSYRFDEVPSAELRRQIQSER